MYSNRDSEYFYTTKGDIIGQNKFSLSIYILLMEKHTYTDCMGFQSLSMKLCKSNTDFALLERLGITGVTFACGLLSFKVSFVCLGLCAFRTQQTAGGFTSTSPHLMCTDEYVLTCTYIYIYDKIMCIEQVLIRSLCDNLLLH